ncbi:MAG: cell division protein FtsZ [Caulobacteraceae bacterium]
MFEFSTREECPAVIKVVGVGGGGNNAIKRMISTGMKGVEYISINTDIKSLRGSSADRIIQIGEKLTRGLGAGSLPEVGEKAALESQEEIKEALRGADMVFLTAGMGGGTGTGATPVVAKIAHDMGILTVGVVTKPFLFEGLQRMQKAVGGIERLKDNVDSLAVILNSRLIEYADRNMSLLKAFQMADEVLQQGIQGVVDTIKRPGIINLDFADVKTILSGAGMAHMGIGTGKGENKCEEAAEQAISNSLVETSLRGARNLMINVIGGNNLELSEVNKAIEQIRVHTGDEANIIFGNSVDEDMEDEMRIILIATGLGEEIQIEVETDNVATKEMDFDISIPDFMNKYRTEA